MKKRISLVIVLIMIVEMMSSCSTNETSSTKKQKTKKTSQTEITEKEIETKSDSETESEVESESEITTVEITTTTSESIQESNSAVYSARPQRNGFDLNKNKVVEVGGYSFSVPEYWTVDISEKDYFSAYVQTESVKSTLDINFVHYDTDGVYADLQAETNSGQMSESIQKGFEKSGIVKVYPYENSTVKGFLYQNDFTLNGCDGQSVLLIFAAENDKDVFWVWLLQADESDYLYTDDFNKILYNIQPLNESAPKATSTPTPTPQPTPTPKPTKTPTPSPTPKPRKHKYEYAYVAHIKANFDAYIMFDTDKQEFGVVYTGDTCPSCGSYKGTFKTGKTVTLIYFGDEDYPGELPTCRKYENSVELKYEDTDPLVHRQIDVSELDSIIGDYAFD